jgi:hypothetical protein
MDAGNDSLGLKLVALGFVAVIAIAGLVLLFTQSSVTGNLAGMQRLGTQGVVTRTPYEACRAVRMNGQQFVWDGYYDPWSNMINCVDPLDPKNPYRTFKAELKLAYG